MGDEAGEIWDVIVVGAGPSGLAAAEMAAARGARVVVLDRMPSVGRKFLMAGKGGLNFTSDAPPERFVQAYHGTHAVGARDAVRRFPPDAIRAWVEGLGVGTFVGSSGRVFPVKMKASPLLRAWVERLREAGVDIRTRRTLAGLDLGADGRALGLAVETTPAPQGLDVETGTAAAGAEIETDRRDDVEMRARAVVLALGGGSWSRLGSDGRWRDVVAALGVETAPFEASNVGWSCDWSAIFRERFAGEPLKNVAVSAGGRTVRGELLVTDYGLEGGPIYALGPEIAAAGGRCRLDLAPDRDRAQLMTALSRSPGKKTVTSWLRGRVGLEPIKIGLLREAGSIAPTPALAARIKAYDLTLQAKRPIDEAISTAGGVAGDALDATLMAHAAPGLFCAGEMTDWDAPTGGYLVNACVALGRAAGVAAARWAKRYEP